MDAYVEVWSQGAARLVPLKAGDSSIGRSESNDVALPSDTSVSRTHAVISPRGASFAVRDLGSTNGTYVNGQRLMAEQVLRPGDEIRVGGSRMIFRDTTSGEESQLTTRVASRIPELTRRERDVLVELCRPLLGAQTFAQPASNQEIATRLYISEAAVKFHLGNLYLKFDTEEGSGQRRAQLANEVIRLGLVMRQDLETTPD
ncbi:MAG TPA: FHA domain-containing protein [Acidimicrobiales bacterium]|nr:FHA domain-containing protein [Acidimicrobiales bacterium]